MGNWLKGRVVLNDVSLITDNTNDNASSTTATTTSQRGLQSQSIIAPATHQSLASIYYPAQYSSSLLVSQFTEEEQIQLAKRIGLIQHLPTGIYDGGGKSKNSRECVICMVEFSKGDSIRFLPCLHTYHMQCIDDWLMRSFICPSCMEPVDVALLSTF